MTIYLGIVSQKGGPGKSTLARGLAVEYTKAEWDTKIMDFDIAQGTCAEWGRRRMENNLQPEIAVQQYSNLNRALKEADLYHLLIFDGAPHSTSQTLEIAKQSDLIVIPTGTTLDDLKPAVVLANNLVAKNIKKKKIAICLCRVGDNQNQLESAVHYIEESGYPLLEGTVPEKPSIKAAHDLGKALTEVPHPAVRGRVDQVIQSIMDRVTKIAK